VAQVVRAAERAAGLTRQLLAFSRRQVLAPRVIDLNSLLHDLEGMLRRLIGEDVELVFRPGLDVGPVRVDPGQMEQVVMNLAVNARDAMPRGGRLTVETAEVDADELRIDGARWSIEPGRYVRLRVSDTGVGMDEATLSRIFEPFYTTKPDGEGTGLGLATVYGIVKQSGGHILVDSAPARGTRFSIGLPRIGAVEDARAAPAPPAHNGAGETILLVEDQDALRAVLGEMLTGLGYRVFAAEDGEAAIALAQEHRGEIHLVLSDVVMPKLSGPEMASRLAQVRPGIKVLFMSGYTSDVLARQTSALSGLPLLEKPISEQVLACRVREAIGAA
jgi:CheY-like chemotaxis protein